MDGLQTELFQMMIEMFVTQSAPLIEREFAENVMFALEIFRLQIAEIIYFIN